ncbi:carboxymuconolactone decarboxylase family protein [Streptomyces beihaiensis]|uniref:Carboxymuconolactone decarboxylase family protein n=1 Tax=Streptomyces beihaiensis TaxID=2984495 RepID=A0ABT3U3R4_9ACTN|nr:carboxymuconolactone decarboxylase family protein [Streptomyces beihaiensis]MCX3062890.1 carboxymuconolactone decarboxylase family protein [Streptomyces beihaiensis]
MLHRAPEPASRMFALGAGLLGHGLLPAADREVVTARVTVRSGCAYESGVRAAALAAQAGLSPEQLRATAGFGPRAPDVREPRHAALIAAVDELHDTARLSRPTWDTPRGYYTDEQLLELLVLAGWYRTISYLANGLLLEEESWSVPFPASTAPAAPPEGGVSSP